VRAVGEGVVVVEALLEMGGLGLMLEAL